MTREVLNQYYDLVREIKEIRTKIDKLERKIPKLEQRLNEIESGETVKDKVKGGEGGWQSFSIEGIPTREYSDKKMQLYIEKKILEDRKEMLKTLEMQSLMQIAEVEKFIKSLPDAHIRRIVTLRVVDGLNWNEVADCIGGGNTENSVKQAFCRLFK